MSDEQYESAAKKIYEICLSNNIPLYVDNRAQLAVKLGIKNLHISAKNLEKTKHILQYFENISVAVHNVEELELAKKYNCNSIVVGHIFCTNCKKDLPPKGLEFLKDMVRIGQIDTYAIGGINLENYNSVLQSGAKDFCIMSSAMTWDIAKLNKFV